MSLSATVRRMRNRENDQRAIAADRDAFIGRWKRDVAAIYELFEEALKPFVDSGDAELSREQTTVAEEPLGEYGIDMLVVEVVGRRVLLVPKARITIGGTGRLDLYREDRPSENNRVLLIRGATAADHDPDLWLIQDRREESSAFQAALVGSAAAIMRRGRAYRGLDIRAIQDSLDYVLNV